MPQRPPPPAAGPSHTCAASVNPSSSGRAIPSTAIPTAVQFPFQGQWPRRISAGLSQTSHPECLWRVGTLPHPCSSPSCRWVAARLASLVHPKPFTTAGFTIVSDAQDITVSQAQSAQDPNHTTRDKCLGGGRTVHHVIIRNNTSRITLAEDIEFRGLYLHLLYPDHCYVAVGSLNSLARSRFADTMANSVCVPGRECVVEGNRREAFGWQSVAIERVLTPRHPRRPLRTTVGI